MKRPLKRTNADAHGINNEFYSAYGERWYCADDDPVALLRAEARIKNAFVIDSLRALFPGQRWSILDIACGGGFLANALAAEGHSITATDISLSSIMTAGSHDASRAVRYLQSDGYALPFRDRSFEAVCVMDFLEHVEEPEKVIAEAGRVLKDGGILFFHTINRTFLSWLVIIKFVEWFVKNTPEHMHVRRLFIKPSELREMCGGHQLKVEELRGIRPKFNWAMMKIPLFRRVGRNFGFTFSPVSVFSYIGYARKGP